MNTARRMHIRTFGRFRMISYRGASHDAVIENNGVMAYLLFGKNILFKKWSVSFAGAEILSLFIHSESVPCCGTENIFLGYIVQTNRNTEY